MSEPQKVATCRYCSQEITWHKDAVSGKNYPKNLNGSPHLCKKNAAAPVTDIAGDAVEKAQAKMAAAGFGQPVQGNKKDCTSNPTPFETSTPNTPALKTVEGQIVEIAPEAHKITVKDRTGALHTMVWAPPMHDQMSRLKQWWFTKITGEHVPDVDLWRLTATEFFKRPEDWPFKPAGGFGGKSFTPRNEKLIVLQSTLKACADVFAITTTPDSMDFDTAMDLIIARAIKDTDTLMKAGVP